MNIKLLFEFLKDKHIKRVLTSEKLAEVTSLCSDPREFRQLWHIAINSSFDCMAVLCIISIMPNISRNQFWIEKIRDHMTKECYQYNYEGDWQIVQEILELRDCPLWNVLETILRYKDTNFIFGNLTRRMLALSGGFRARSFYRSAVDDKRPVRQKIRRRGYNDKGTLPDPQRLGIEYYFEPRNAKKDLRDKVWFPRRHQLLDQRTKRRKS